MPILNAHKFKTMTEAIAELRAQGYEYDFHQHSDHLECKKLEKQFAPDSFTISHVYRFEGMTNPSDNAVLYGVEANDGTKGTLTDAYGVYAEMLTPEMIEKFRIDYAGVVED